MSKPSIVMQSDFGIDSGLVSCMQGVCKKVAPTLEIYDITHIIEPFNIKQASDCLAMTIPCWPDGTVFVSVVDPGVGTKRKASVAKLSNGTYVVTPDNGALTKLQLLFGIDEIREIDESINRYQDSEHVDIFHGRDLFSYTAARLAAGIIAYDEVGPAYGIEQIVTYDIPPFSIGNRKVAGFASGNPDNDFGILSTNIPNQEFLKAGFKLYEKLHVVLKLQEETIFDQMVTYGTTFGDVPQGQPVLYQEVALFMGLALNMENFARAYSIQGNVDYEMLIEG